tara:strand:- start:372 stop:491 length:120 start_codon:yes stop_codon:yes gene_type:complete
MLKKQLFNFGDFSVFWTTSRQEKLYLSWTQLDGRQAMIY